MLGVWVSSLPPRAAHYPEQTACPCGCRDPWPSDWAWHDAGSDDNSTMRRKHPGNTKNWGSPEGIGIMDIKCILYVIDSMNLIWGVFFLIFMSVWKLFIFMMNSVFQNCHMALAFKTESNFWALYLMVNYKLHHILQMHCKWHFMMQYML